MDHTCKCVRHAHDSSLLRDDDPFLFCGCTSDEHAVMVWDCSFAHLLTTTTAIDPTVDSTEHAQLRSIMHDRREKLAEIMLGIIPPCIGGDVRDWEKGDESETMVHNMVSTSVVHGSEMPINLSQVRCVCMSVLCVFVCV